MKNPGLRRLKKSFPNLAPVAGLFLVIFGIIGLLFVQKPLQESQENRPDATVVSGFAEVSSISTPSATYKVNEGESIDFEIGLLTKDLTQNNFTGIHSVDLVFDIVTDTANTVEVMATLPGFNQKSTEIESTDSGFFAAVKLEAYTQEVDLQFPMLAKVLNLKVTPQKSGDFKIIFHRSLSKVIASDTDQDILTVPKTITYQIEVPVDPITPPVDPALNSKTCNQDCTKNADCIVSLSCISNKCRNPKNSPSLTCVAPSDSQTTAQIASCNQSCLKNADCAINYRCFDSGSGLRCRLATNPSSSSCSPYTEKIVTAQYPKKGGDFENNINDNTNVSGSSADQDNTQNSDIQETQPSSSPIPTPTPEEEMAARMASEQTAFDTVINLLKDGQFSLPVIILLVGIIILILSLVFHLVKSVFGRKPTQEPPRQNYQANKGESRPSSTPIQDKKPIPPPPPQRPQAGLEHPPQLNGKANLASSNSMIERMKQKGIQVPGSGDTSKD